EGRSEWLEWKGGGGWGDGRLWGLKGGWRATRRREKKRTASWRRVLHARHREPTWHERPAESGRSSRLRFHSGRSRHKANKKSWFAKRGERHLAWNVAREVAFPKPSWHLDGAELEAQIERSVVGRGSDLIVKRNGGDGEVPRSASSAQ